ncbi:hypothetical protein M1C57_11920 [Rhodococcus pyridinivorans]|uniref:Uncharacterized protein n=1 Tax=Rhodococcus pyridinivorans TaxID=103816 RepID=A0A7M2XMQ0_9NOCA|nr:hypothetical protein [Rhodococcus pyridinivorans]QOV98683.1 hypothetical protein INP59_23255 [Rhodococcus pyridinivorans]UPW02455.1 hypothetical protein M1C57_11920 [Rhodococcus pyridinivorans]WMM72584.1 hypothetical protein RCF27_22690 [Rhodococcus pyridinivorans]
MLGGAYRRIRPALGEFTRTIDVLGETFSGERMADHDRLAERLADTGNRWGCNDPRVNGTLWWYSASSTMVAALVTVLCAEGIAPIHSCNNSRARCTITGISEPCDPGGFCTTPLPAPRLWPPRTGR